MIDLFILLQEAGSGAVCNRDVDLQCDEEMFAVNLHGLPLTCCTLLLMGGTLLLAGKDCG